MARSLSSFLISCSLLAAFMACASIAAHADDASPVLSVTEAIPPGSKCWFGGQKTHYFADRNRNGKLDAGETIETYTKCYDVVDAVVGGTTSAAAGTTTPQPAAAAVSNSQPTPLGTTVAGSSTAAPAGQGSNAGTGG
jgi:hypothetical protein